MTSKIEMSWSMDLFIYFKKQLNLQSFDGLMNGFLIAFFDMTLSKM